MSCLCLPGRSRRAAPRKSTIPKRSDGLSPPTTSEYFFEGVKISLELLSQLADAIPIPYVKTAVNAAQKVVQVGESTKSNIELLDDLSDRICALMVVLIQPLKGMKPEEIPADLEINIGRVTTVLQEIADVLDSIAAQNYLLMLVFQRKNTEKVTNASRKIDEALQQFSVASKIAEAVRLCTLATDIRHMANELTEIRALLVQRVHGGSSSPLPLIPQNSGAFSGRDFIVEDIVHRMCNSERPRIAILGQGGIGKTSVAYAVMNSPQVVEHFHTKRFWVPCVQANSPSRLLDIMVKNLNITQNTSDALQDIISELNATPAPRAILFDNFETAWDQDQQSEVQRILRSLDAVSHLSILLTMRSKTPPTTDINWHTEKLSPLDAEMARLVYVKIHDKAEADIALDELLLELDHVPLAITLMATLGTASGFMPTDLLETWKHEGTDMLSHSRDPDRSMNRSIGLSVNSPLMKAYPHALSVLTTLAMLPGGADRTLLVKIFPLSTNIAGAVAAITQSALAEDRPTTGSIHVHSLIRTYMLTCHPLDDETRGRVHQAFYQILSEHTSKPGDAKFSEDVRALATHESNIYTILLDAARNGGNQVVLDALLSFSWYQCWTRPNKEIIDYTVQLARDAQSKRHLAEGLLCRGQIYQQLDCYPDAAIAIQEARQLFLEVEDRRRAAECLLKLGEAYSYQLLLDLYGEAVRLAQKEFQSLGDKLGIAESLRYVGMYLWKTRQILAAQQALDNSRQQFEDLRHPLGVAHCRAWSSRVYLELKQYPEACDAALDALPVFRNLGDKDAIVRCLIRLTRALKPMLEGSSGSERMVIHERALKAIKEGLEVGLVQGRPLAIGQLYEELGDICHLQGTQDTARDAYQ